MMNLTTTVKDMKNIMGICKVIGNDIPIYTDYEGLHVVAVDPAHVVLLTMDIPSYQFDDYMACKRVSVDPKDILKKLSFGTEKTVTFVTDERMTMKIGSISQGCNLLPEFDGSIKIPQPSMVNMFRIHTKRLVNTVKVLSEISDHLKITVNADTVTFYSYNDEVENVIVYSDSAKEVMITAQSESITLFPCDYLKAIVKALPSTVKEVAIELSTDYPMRLSFDFMGGRTEFLLAPRLESE